MPSDRTSELVHLGGLTVALAGFAITRFVVAGTLEADAGVPFFIGMIPLVVGLAFTVYGVVLAVGDLSETYVDTVVRWTLLGVATMVGVLALTAIGSQTTRVFGMGVLMDSQLLVANALLGGAVGGALTGDRAGVNRRQREEIELQAELAVIANGLLRHEVLNATSIIDGYASVFTTGEQPRDTDITAIREAADRIETTVADIGEVGRARDSNPRRPTPLEPVLREEIEAFEDRYPGADVTLSIPGHPVDVLADHRIRLLVRKFLETVAARNDAPTIGVEVVPDTHNVRLEIRSDVTPAEVDGPTGDDPAVGFDRRIVDLLSGYYDGSFDVRPSATGDTAVTAVLELPRTTGDRTAVGRLGIPSTGIAAAVIAGLVAGVVMGVLSQYFIGLLPVIGALYGVASPVVGWITHLFHSVVFALLFAAGYTHVRDRVSAGPTVASGVLGTGWGVLLWLVAAGLIMPIWLRLVGISAPLPELTVAGLATHAAWGAVLGVLYPIVRDRFASSDWLDDTETSIGRRFRSMLGGDRSV